MPRDPRVEKLQRLRTERVTRAPGGYYGTRATAQGNVRNGPRKRDTGRTLLSLVLFVVIIAAVLYMGSQYVMHGLRPASPQADHAVTVTIPPGESASALATLLHDKGLVASSQIFYLYLRANNVNYTAGAHTLHTSMTMEQVAQAITAPAAVSVATVLIYSGWRAEQVAQTLADAGVASYSNLMGEINNGKFTYGFLADRPAGASLEGYLLPDTYKFPLHGSAHAAIDEMLQAFDRKVASATDVVARGKKRYGSFYNTIIMASIVEREAGTNHDRPLIASVYYNRLHDASGQYLDFGADPTIQYILGHAGDWWPQITQGDVARTKNKAMNTYRHPGLPPQPIASPSLASIEAAVNPANTQDIAFTHTNGSHGMSRFCTAQQYQEAGLKCATPPR